jgi:hypothetical protein
VPDDAQLGRPGGIRGRFSFCRATPASAVELAPGANRVAKQYGALEKEALEILGRRDARELAAIGSFLQDMNELGVRHVARLERQAQKR